jgi:hypothetical protein
MAERREVAMRSGGASRARGELDPILDFLRDALSPEALSLYLRLANRSESGPLDAADEVVQELVSSSLAVVVRERPLEVRVTSPARAVREVLLRDQVALLDEYRRVMQGHRLLDELDRVAPGPVAGVRRIEPADIVYEYCRLIALAENRCLILDSGRLGSHLYKRIVEEAYTLMPRLSVRCRKIASVALLEDPATAIRMKEEAARRIEHRVVRGVGFHLLVVDGHALLISARGFTDVAVHTDDPMIVAVLVEYFGMHWESGIPLSGLGTDTDATAKRRELRLQVLRLGVQGLKDEAIARLLGMSLRSVRRCFEAMSLEVGAQNRLMLGVESVRRGWI